MSVGWEIVGLGGIAQLMARAIGGVENATLTAVCSRDPSKASNFAARRGAAAHYSSFDELLLDPKVDVVYVATPNALHSSQTLAASRAGKHVLVEKPMALKVADAQDMVAETCRDEGSNTIYVGPGEKHWLKAVGDQPVEMFMAIMPKHAPTHTFHRADGTPVDWNRPTPGSPEAERRPLGPTKEDLR